MTKSKRQMLFESIAAEVHRNVSDPENDHGDIKKVLAVSRLKQVATEWADALIAGDHKTVEKHGKVIDQVIRTMDQGTLGSTDNMLMEIVVKMLSQGGRKKRIKAPLKDVTPEK